MSETPTQYRYALEHFTRDGRTLGQAPVTPDFQPARECAAFEAVRRGARLVTAPAEAPVMPIWSRELGPPHVSGIRVLESDFPQTYFLDLVEKKATDYVASGELAVGETYLYRVCAYAADADRPPAGEPAEGALDFGAEAIAEPIALEERALAELIAGSDVVGEADPDDAPVFVADPVLAEVCALSEQAGELETGGVLIGRLHRDTATPEVFAEVTAQIPARHAEARGTSFAFTPETWAAAEAALALRGAGERMLGWWHRHPYFCRRCPEESRRVCKYGEPFFSGEDVHLHHTCFPQAWQLALLVSELPERGHVPALFGWRKGRVVERGFRKLRSTEKEEG